MFLLALGACTVGPELPMLTTATVPMTTTDGPATTTFTTGDVEGSTGGTDMATGMASSGDPDPDTTAGSTTGGDSSSTGAPTDDMDADGVTDAMDNCPIDPNPGQEDGDADLVGDACDNCPLVENALQSDQDGDMIGDFCDVEVVDTPEVLYIPDGVDYPMSGAHCYTDEVRIHGTVTVDPFAVAVPGSGTLVLTSEVSVWVAPTGQIDGGAAGHPGGISAPSNGGMAGAGPQPGCGGGPGSAVANGGSGGGYGGAGGTADSTTTWASGNLCSPCSQPTQAHCYGAAGLAAGTPTGPDVAMGSGGGAGGNSSGCTNSGGYGGAGGGAVTLAANDRVRIDGLVSVDGQTPGTDASACGYRPGGGGGAGGGLIVAADLVEGDPGAMLTARGGTGGQALGDASSTWGWAGGGGGGGRIKIFGTSSYMGATDVAAGPGGAAPVDPYSYAGFPGNPGTYNAVVALPPMLDNIACN